MNARLTAHVAADGSIVGLVLQPPGEVQAMPVPEPGSQVCEIDDHGLADAADVEGLSRLREEHAVEVVPATGRLVPRRGEAPS